MPSKAKSNLSLNRVKRRRNTIQKTLTTFLKIKKPVVKVFTPEKELLSPRKHNSSLKRLIQSPFGKTFNSDRKHTPSKSPLSKRVKRSLNTEFPHQAIEDSNVSNTRDIIFDIVEDYDIDTCVSSTCDALSDIPDTNPILEEIQVILPHVIEKLSKEGFDKRLLDFCRQVKSEIFPLKNIAFLLWMEVVKWYSAGQTSNVRYCDETKKFWKLGYTIFGGKFINFMSGYKTTDSSRSDPDLKSSHSSFDSEINFAVPDVNVLRNFKPYSLTNVDNELARKPGLLTDMIHSMSKVMANTSCCLTFDGKKLKQGLKSSSGDVDILGYEKGPSLAVKKEDFERNIGPVKEVSTLLLQYASDMDLQRIDRKDKTQIIAFQMSTLKTISEEVLEVRAMRRRKVYAKDKLIERNGESNWKNGKFAYAISAQIAFIHDIDKFLQKAIALNEELVKCIGYLNECSMTENQRVNLSTLTNYNDIDQLRHMDVDIANKLTRVVKQRSELEFNARKHALVTGSTLYKAVGLDGLKRQKEYLDSVVCGIPEKEKTDEVKQAMAYGTDNEPNAMATLASKIMPLLYPKEIVCEEGYVEIGESNKGPFMIVSPDGSVRSSNQPSSTLAAVELKCPLFDVHSKIPERYLLQCLSEIEALNVDELVYVSWSPDISSFFRLKRNTALFDRACELARNVYDVTEPKRPKKLSPEIRNLKNHIEAECNGGNNIDFLGIISSVKHDGTLPNIHHNEMFRVSRMDMLIKDVENVYQMYYELRREPASEAVVFLCCDLNREWIEDGIRNAPVCWFPKGYSLDTCTMRKVLEWVLDECKSSGLHIPAICFDGQWHNICVRSKTGKPLTLLQLQKDVWKTVENMPKRDILKEIKRKNVDAKWHWEESCYQKQILVTDHTDVRLPSISQGFIRYRRREIQREELKTQAQEHNSSFTNVTIDEEHLISELTLIHDVGPGNVSELSETANSNLSLEIISDSEKNDGYTRVNTDNDIIEENERKTLPIQSLSEEEYQSILAMLQADEKSNNKNRWTNSSTDDLRRLTRSYEELKKIRDVELRIIVRYLNKVHSCKIKESLSKHLKLAAIFKNMDSAPKETTNSVKSIRKVRTVKSLSELAFLELKKFKKADINVIYAEYLWPEKLKEWRDDYPIAHQFPNVDDRFETSWFYCPDISESRHQVEVSCIDSTHLLTRARRKSCKGGLDGLSNTVWRTVAKSNKTRLSLAMVDCVLEPMSVSVARTHFSASVEAELRGAGEYLSADLCRDVRQWWEAEDDRGIAAIDRLQMRMPLRKRLLSYVTFSNFPPPTSHINGWPSQLWEALVANIDAKAMLYDLCLSKTYNVRAFSSMMGETFFAELTHADKRSHGTVTSEEFGQFINNTVEQLHMRMDPNRVFAYRTSKRHVYKLVDRSENESDNSHTAPGRIPDYTPESSCFIRDHAFDTNSHRQPKCKEGAIKTDRNAVKRGSLGVRWESARRNESKLLITDRLGI